ncbi:3585_t:CDS:2 [Entrophospora sp. SA101]|nr:3585_t:CDS:2 [Entrophospora sp. SA101]
MTTFTLHPNVIRAMSDQWSDIVHFEPFETNNSNIDISGPAMSTIDGAAPK